MTAPTTVEGGGVAAYPRAGDAAWVRQVVRDLYRPVLGHGELRRYFRRAGDVVNPTAACRARRATAAGAIEAPWDAGQRPGPPPGLVAG